MNGQYERIFLNSLKAPNIQYKFKSVEEANTYINSLGDEAKNLDQNAITQLYENWSLGDQKKFIWVNGIKPDFISNKAGLVF